MPMTVTRAQAGVYPSPRDPRLRRGDGLWGVALLLAACSPANDQPGAVSADEASQLNEAAAMLDANSVDLNALPANESAAP